tara:strand:- start:564 stop:884 length:321 start_codon:yes stop_codon:yes gene_type:complete
MEYYKGIVWNIVHLPSVLRKRVHIQKKVSKASDRAIFSRVMSHRPIRYYLLGEFCIDSTLEGGNEHDYLFIATGTGIAPFRSFVRTFPEIQYQLVHADNIFTEAFF